MWKWYLLSPLLLAYYILNEILVVANKFRPKEIKEIKETINRVPDL